MKDCPNIKSLQHTRCNFDLFNALSEWAVNEAGGADKVFGTKPKVADYEKVNLGDEYGKAIDENLANLPEIKKLLEQILPGYSELISEGTQNALSLIKGEVPEDVQQSLQRSSAFKSLMGGYGGSPMSRALTARDLGRTSLDLTQMGENSAQRWTSLATGTTAPFMVTGPQQAATTTQNNLLDQAVRQFQYNVDAAPDPGAAGIFNLQTALGSMAASFGMGSAMGAMGGSRSGGGGGQQWGQGVRSTNSAPPVSSTNGNNLAYNDPWASDYQYWG